MDVILIPGFWLDAASWEPVTPAIVEAGHRVHPVTLPGLESVETDRSGIGLRDHIDHVVRLIDDLDGPVVLVGHSGGGNVMHGAVDARPGRVVRAIYVDTLPPAEGFTVNQQLPVVDGEVPLPEWSFFGDEDLFGLDDATLAAFRARAVPVPTGAARDPIELHDPRRYDVPITVVACEFPSSMIAEWQAAGHPWLAELSRVREVEIVDLPTGHWPQFTRPGELGSAIAAAIR